jgi:methyl-accepting chemotaxis protein
MLLRPLSRAAPIRWLQEVAPIQAKLFIAFSFSAFLTAISLALAWAAFHRVGLVLGDAARPLEPLLDGLVVARIVIMGMAIAAGVVFGRIIAVPYLKIVERMEALAKGDLDAPIPFTHYQDCVGRIAKAVYRFRENAIASNAAAELNASQAAELRDANTRLEDLARDLTWTRPSMRASPNRASSPA